MPNEPENTKLKIRFLKAFKGDAILISLFENDTPRNILIDGGEAGTYSDDDDEPGELKEVIDDIKTKKQKLDLLILTHIDDDHIGGILKWFEEDEKAFEWIEEVWFNSGGLIAKVLKENENKDLEMKFTEYTESCNTSVAQGIEFGKYIKKNNISWRQEIIIQGQELEKCGVKFKILSPNIQHLKRLLHEWKKKAPDSDTAAKECDYNRPLNELIEYDYFKEDASLSNGSSIAFIMTWKNKNFLFLSDAHSSTVEAGIRSLNHTEIPLKCELVKVSHHGSVANSSMELLDLIESKNYVISTNGQDHYHPHKRLLARLINLKPDINIYFNYYLEERWGPSEIFSEEDRKAFSFRDIEITNEFEF